MELYTLYSSGSNSIVEHERSQEITDLRRDLSSPGYLQLNITTPSLKRIDSLLSNATDVIISGEEIKTKANQTLKELGLENNGPYCGLEFYILNPNFRLDAGTPDNSLHRLFYLSSDPTAMIIHDTRNNTATVLAEVLSLIRGLGVDDTTELKEFFNRQPSR